VASPKVVTSHPNPTTPMLHMEFPACARDGLSGVGGERGGVEVSPT
jgi:hypothetical protein